VNEELIARLRAARNPHCQQAADRIEAQAAHIEGLEAALRDAASSLNTIAEQGGRDEYMRDWLEVRGYAANRCAAARAALAPKESSK
jgi:hypothetical protein